MPGLREDRERWLRGEAIPALAVAADIRFSRAVNCREDVEKVVGEYESAGVDVLMVVFLTYAPSQIVLPSLKRTRLPAIIWNTQELSVVDNGFNVEQMIQNHGVHGTQDLANVLVRSEVPFHFITSHLSDSRGCKELFDYFAVAGTVSRLRSCRLGLLGYPFPGMGDLALDSTQMAATLGCSCLPLSLEEYHNRAAAAASEVVEELKAEYRRCYEVAADVEEIDLDAAARAEISLRSIVADQNLDAFSFQFLALGEDSRTETLPFVAASRMMADGIGFAGEGDLIGALGTWFLHQLSSPASFSEIFTIDFAGNGLILSHMGEANAAMARKDRKTPLVAKSQPITRTRRRQLALVAGFEPGPATLCTLNLGPQGRWRVIVSRMEIEDFLF